MPAGYASLLPHLKSDQEFAEAFFSRMRLVFFAAAALPQQIWGGIAKVAASVGAEATMTTSWGATETAPAATSAYFASGRSDCIGVPLPGVSIKLAPVGPKLEIRVKGPYVTPGYFGNPDQTRAAFDEDGYYRTGDAVRMVNEAEPGQGLVFDGRISEDFKLATGTWVSGGTLRPALLSASDGLISDAVLTGHDTDYIGALVWLNPAKARALAGPQEALGRSAAVRTAVGAAVRRLNGEGASGSRRSSGPWSWTIRPASPTGRSPTRGRSTSACRPGQARRPGASAARRPGGRSGDRAGFRLRRRHVRRLCVMAGSADVR